MTDYLSTLPVGKYISGWNTLMLSWLSILIYGSWAAKEAIIKASSRFYRGQVENGQHRKPGFLDITIWSDKGIPKAAILSTPRKPSAERIASESEGFATQNNENLNALKGTAAMTIGDPSPESSADVLDYLQSLDGDIVEISISHERDYAVATALFCDPKARSDIELND
jgi:phosphopantetheinyl transferase (holo-ACP synthase)